MTSVPTSFGSSGGAAASRALSVARGGDAWARYLARFVPESLTDEGQQSDLQRRARVMVLACHAAVVIAAIGSVLRGLLGVAPSAQWWLAVGGTAAGMAYGPILLRGTGSVRRASVVPLATTALLVPVIGLRGGGLDAPVLATIPAVPLIAVYFAGAPAAKSLALVMGVEVVALALGIHAGVLRPGPPPPPLVRAAMYVCFLTAAATIGVAYDRERRAAESQLRSLARGLYEGSIRDALTGAFNRRYFARRLEEELAYARRHGESLGVLIMDLDHFKGINDQHGHAAGDHVLHEFAALARGVLRAEDVFARYGGEEFVVLLRGADVDGARGAAERLRAAVERHTFEFRDRRIPVTVSVGCAQAGAGEDADGVLRRADEQLYAAKSDGRNRVVAN